MLVSILGLALLCVGVQEMSATEAVSKSEGLYAAWSMGPSSDPAEFPIGVWLQDPRHAEAYRELGINTFVGLWQGPTQEQFDALKQAGMRLVCAQNAFALSKKDDPTIVAWMQVDEPDNREKGQEGKPRPRRTPEQVQRFYQRLKERDPTRPVWLNLGQGVANDAFKGRAAKPADYPEYARGCDILSFDIYPVANLKRDDGGAFLWLIAKGLRRMAAWAQEGGKERPLWNVVECTSIHDPSRKATPDQVRSEVWMSLIHGSRGIVWFVHQFQPKLRTAALLDDSEMMAAVKAINAEVLRWAPVLYADELAGVDVASAETGPVSFTARRHEGYDYVLAIGMRQAATRATFSLPSASAGLAEVEVVGEDRRLPVVDGRFEDAFGPFEVHHYRWATQR